MLSPAMMVAAVIMLVFAGMGASVSFPATAEAAAETATSEISKSSQSAPKEVQILLGFKERYGPENKQHLGIDVFAAKGANFHAPVSGTISFVGRVPGSAGLNVTALTITTDAGHQVSINPFASTQVKKGDSVNKGQVLGAISDVGDPSSPESHFHLSLREGGVYKDPTHLLFAGILGSGTDDKNEPSTQHPAVVAPDSLPANSSSSAAAQPQPQTKPQSQPQKSTAKNTSAQTSAQPEGQKVAKQGLEPAQAEHSSSEKVLSTSTETDKEASADMQLQRIAASDPSFARGDNMAQAAVDQKGVLQISNTGIGLQREFLAYLEGLSQTQLAAGMFAALVMLSCAVLGAWKTVQLMGFDSAVTNCAEKLMMARTAKQDKEGETT